MRRRQLPDFAGAAGLPDADFFEPFEEPLDPEPFAPEPDDPEPDDPEPDDPEPDDPEPDEETPDEGDDAPESLDFAAEVVDSLVAVLPESGEDDAASDLSAPAAAPDALARESVR